MFGIGFGSYVYECKPTIDETDPHLPRDVPRKTRGEPRHGKMSDTRLMQYVGFDSKDQGREYRFQVRYTTEDTREFTLTIPSAAFISHLVRYQDAPDVCSLKLQRELATNADHASKTDFPVTDAELEDYRLAHTSKSPKSRYSLKPQSDS